MCGFVQFKEYCTNTTVVWVNTGNADKPQLWFSTKWKNESDHTCGLLQNGKWRLTTPVGGLKMDKRGQPQL